MLGFERNLHSLFRDGELELFFAGEPSYRGEQKIVRHAQVFFDRRERGLPLVGQVEPNRTGGFSDLMIAECGSSGRGFNVGRSFGRRLGSCFFGVGGKALGGKALGDRHCHTFGFLFSFPQDIENG